MSEISSIFEQYRTSPVNAECYRELGQAIQQQSQSELQELLGTIQPNDLHLQLLKLRIGRSSKCFNVLFDGLKSEYKSVTEFCSRSNLLYCRNSSTLLNSSILLPLLKSVSLSTRTRVLYNLGKHSFNTVTCNDTICDADAVYYDVAKIWGFRTAQPLLCLTSQEVLKKHSLHGQKLSKYHLLTIAKRYPYVALAILETHISPAPKAAQYIIRKTIPKSFDYLLKVRRKRYLSKSTMRVILKNHRSTVLDAPSSWIHVLDEKVVKRILTPTQYEAFLFQLLMELEGMHIQYELRPYLKLLAPIKLSLLMKKVFHEKYSCSLDMKLDFWEANTDLLKLIDSSDRSSIAEALNLKNSLSNDWAPFMTADKSIPIIKGKLYTEQDVHGRANRVSDLIETTVLNNDMQALEEICKFVVNRYRNDKMVLQTFFRDVPDLSFLPADSWGVIFDAAKKFYAPGEWQTSAAAKCFFTAIKYDGLPALKEWIIQYFKSPYSIQCSELKNLDAELRYACILEAFSEVHMKNDKTFIHLANFLPLITEWNASSPVPLITDNVKLYVMTALRNDRVKSDVTDFVCSNFDRLELSFIEECFQYFINPSIISFILSKNASIVCSEEAVSRLATHLLKNGFHGYTKLLHKFKMQGYLDVLKGLASQSQSKILDESCEDCNNAVSLFMLSTSPDEFFSTFDPLLPSIHNNKFASPEELMQTSDNDNKYCPYKSSKKQESLYKGLGLSLSHIDLPDKAVDRLLLFCVGGDLVLFVRDALYSVCSFLPSETAEKMLHLLMKQPVSVKKHSLRILRQVCDLKSQEALLQAVLETESHLSMRIILVNTAISSLKDSMSVSMWHMLRNMLKKVTPTDKDIITGIMHEKVPDEFFEEYLHILLDKSRTLVDIETVGQISSIIQLISNDVKIMSVQFIENLLKEFFLSELFFDKTNSHSAICSLFVGYLRHSLNAGKSPQKSLNDRRQFLTERLKACASQNLLDTYSIAQRAYPVQTLLLMFVEQFSSSCLYSKSHSDSDGIYQLEEYFDVFLSFFSQLNPITSFWPRVVISLTKICTDFFLESPYFIGVKVGELCDAVFAESGAMCYCTLPEAIKSFLCTTSFTSKQVLDLLRGILGIADLSTPCMAAVDKQDDLPFMLRLLTVAHILPRQWQQEIVYKDFVPVFLTLIKNTHVETYVFNVKD